MYHLKTSLERTVPFHFPPEKPLISSRSRVIVRKNKWYTDFPNIPVKTRKEATSEGIPFSPKNFQRNGLFHLISHRNNWFFHANGSACLQANFGLEQLNLAGYKTSFHEPLAKIDIDNVLTGSIFVKLIDLCQKLSDARILSRRFSSTLQSAVISRIAR